MADQIVPGLYSTQRAANIFLLDGDDLTLIDTGMPGATKPILKLISEIGRNPSDVRHILLTHADIDHVGSVAGVVAATGAETYSGAETAQYIQSSTSPPHIPWFAQLIGGMVQKLLQKPINVDHILTDGQVLPIAGGIRVIATPGHTPDNMSYFWERERVLFCPDLLTNMKGLNISAPAVTHDMEAVKRSTRKVLALDPVVICFGHGKPFYVKETPGEIDALLRKLD